MMTKHRNDVDANASGSDGDSNTLNNNNWLHKIIIKNKPRGASPRAGLGGGGWISSAKCGFRTTAPGILFPPQAKDDCQSQC